MDLTLREAIRRVVPCLAAALFIGNYTLRPGEGGPTGLRPGGYLLTDVILNIILFVPLGMSLVAAGIRPRYAAMLGLLTSSMIELAQLWWIPGREAALHDVITNTTGTVLGGLIVASWSDRARLWRTAGPVIAALLVTIWVIGAFLLAPSVPPPRQWYGQWAHEIDHHEVFTGKVSSVSIEGVAVADGLIANPEMLHDRLAGSERIRMSVTVVTGPPVSGISQLASIVASRNEMVGIWQDGTALIARHQLKLTDAGLRTPWIRLAGALPPESGDTVSIVYEVSAHDMRVIALTRGDTLQSEMRLSPDLFWSAFLPFDWQGGNRARWWPLLPALLAYVMLGLALGSQPLLLALSAMITLFLGPLLGAGAFPDVPGVAIALVGVLPGALLGRRLGFYEAEKAAP